VIDMTGNWAQYLGVRLKERISIPAMSSRLTQMEGVVPLTGIPENSTQHLLHWDSTALLDGEVH